MTNSSLIMGRAAKQRPSPISIRLSDEQRAELQRRAGNQPLGTFIKAALFDARATGRRSSPTATPMDHAALARALSTLGRSNLASNLATLAKAADAGNLYFGEETRKQITQACKDVAEIRSLLMQALGKRSESKPSAVRQFEEAIKDWRARL